MVRIVKKFQIVVRTVDGKTFRSQLQEEDHADAMYQKMLDPGSLDYMRFQKHGSNYIFYIPSIASIELVRKRRLQWGE